jgi:hypothetical protein
MENGKLIKILVKITFLRVEKIPKNAKWKNIQNSRMRGFGE